MPPEQPSGAVTLVFSDIEGSTRLLHELGAEAYRDALAEHRAIVREAYARYSGYEVDYEGDAFFYAFSSASAAMGAVSEAMDGLKDGPIAIRVGIHTGEPALDPPKYVGMDVHFAARVMSSAHGGQVVVSAATRAACDDRLQAVLVPLGSYRLKDISEPVSLHQLGEGSFPALKTIANSNLPTPASSFLGREDELHEADLLLQRTRLLTIHGPGGQGKTRFALELATRAREERFSDYQDGVFSCFLSSLRDPALVLPTIAQTLSVREQPGVSALEALSTHLQARKMLLLLDNAEHLLDCASELSHLLSACSNLTLVVTSRELLRIQGESTFGLPPLPEADGIALFCERSQLEPSPTIAEIATRLEGLPLAIELAAARTRILTPEQLLERLSERLDLLKGGRDADPRQQTLRATIEWSYDLLTPEEQQLLARLSVFAGGCTLEAAEEVCEADLDLLQSLVDKSLVRFSDERFWMLETIRDFAGERLENERDARDAHAEFVTSWCARTRGELYDGNDASAVRDFDDESHNIREAVAWLHENGRYDDLLRLVAQAIDFWEIRGEWAEGRRWADHALEHGTEPEARARVLTMVGAFARHARDWNASREYQLESLAIYRSLDELGATAPVLNGLSNVAAELGQYEEAERYLEEAIDVARSVGSDRVIAMCTGNLADLALRQGDNMRALELATTAVGLYRRLGWGPGLAWCLYLEAVSRLRARQIRGSIDATREALSVGADTETLTWLFVLSSAIAAQLGRVESGAVLLGLVGALTEQLDLSLTGAERDLLRDATKTLRQVLGDEGLESAALRARALTAEDGVALALASID